MRRLVSKPNAFAVENGRIRAMPSSSRNQLNASGCTWAAKEASAVVQNINSSSSSTGVMFEIIFCVWLTASVITDLAKSIVDERGTPPASGAGVAFLRFVRLAFIAEINV
jgi:hypothetical protein